MIAEDDFLGLALLDKGVSMTGALIAFDDLSRVSSLLGDTVYTWKAMNADCYYRFPCAITRSIRANPGEDRGPQAGPSLVTESGRLRHG